ncbi:T9SS type A sorting domain-containing protein [Gracilimonas tropica]|uniref:T9SS type A sorting domain-containing protein n=1 Tax=Gracilimonas tropica TaxID=454600 RepID=UPI0003680B73|nr:T9SS type A sorting domain-containing protein [Gracilimonas tropica]
MFQFKPALLFSVLLLVPIFAFSQQQDSTAAIHFVYGSDTSTPGINVNDRTSLYNNAGFELFASPTGNAAQVMKQSYRDQFKDSFGNSLPLTWWMQGGSLYRYATNTNIPLGSTMSIHLMQKYHADKVEELGDEMTFHYHTWEWSDVNGDGRFYWNQTDDFNKVKDDFMLTLAEHLVEENMFPVSFRSGWHYMDNAWQATLNDWIPFSLHNNSPVQTNPTVEPIDNLIDWGHATLDFIPFQPSEEDYQVGGGNRGWNTRSRYFLRLTEDEVRQIFEQAKAGTTQVAAIWGHLAEPTFLNNMEQSLALIYKVAEEYPDVPFHFSTAVDAMQDYLGTADTTAPEISVIPNWGFSGNSLVDIQISTDEPIFQKTPFLVFKDVYEEYHIIPMNEAGENTWGTDFINIDGVAKVGIAVTDTAGNLATKIINPLPDEIYVDNVDDAFNSSASGQSVLFSSVNHIWGRNFEQFVVQPGDSVSASWSATIPAYEAAPAENQQQVYVRLPDVEDPVQELRAVISIDGVKVTEQRLDNLTPNKWLFVDMVSVSEGEEVTTQLTAYNNSDTPLNFGADVVKYSALVKDRQLELPAGKLDFREVMIDQPTEIELPLTNRGNETLTVSNLSWNSDVISFDTALPFTIPAHSTKFLTLTLNSSVPTLVRDTLHIESNDPVNPVLSKNYEVEFRNYFRIVDNEDRDAYSEVGDWNYSSAEAYGQTSRYAFIQSAGDPSATFTTTAEKAGFYNISFIVPKATNSALRSDYELFINGESVNTYRINQNLGSGNWVTLDMTFLEAGDEVAIQITVPDKDQPNKVLRADAFQIAYIGEELEEDIIDNASDLYSEVGDWSTSVTEAYGSNSRYVFYDPNASATFKYPVSQTSTHHLSMIVPETENASNEAQYSVYQNGSLRGSVVLNQNEKSATWRDIGSWSFVNGDTLSVVVQNVESYNSSRVLRADAIKVQYGVPKAVSNDAVSSLPKSFSLSQNYPNPFNPTTNILYTVPKRANVSLKVYNVLGELVSTLKNEVHNPGSYQVSFNGKNLASGVYFYRLEAPDFTETKSFTLIK